MSGSFHASRADYGELGKLIDRWVVVAGEIAAGYAFGLYDYENDIVVRGLIEELLVSGSTLPGVMARKLSRADERVRKLLVPVSKPLAAPGEPTDFWRAGIPQNGGEELLADARSLSLLPSCEADHNSSVG